VIKITVAALVPSISSDLLKMLDSNSEDSAQYRFARNILSQVGKVKAAFSFQD
jgi:hypothetical protein